MRFNILDFGAAGDGVTDDTPAVRAAMEAARDEAGDSTVLFPGGTPGGMCRPTPAATIPAARR